MVEPQHSEGESEYAMHKSFQAAINKIMSFWRQVTLVRPINQYTHTYIYVCVCAVCVCALKISVTIKVGRKVPCKIDNFIHNMGILN